MQRNMSTTFHKEFERNSTQLAHLMQACIVTAQACIVLSPVGILFPRVILMRYLFIPAGN